MALGYRASVGACLLALTCGSPACGSRTAKTEASSAPAAAPSGSAARYSAVALEGLGLRTDESRDAASSAEPPAAEGPPDARTLGLDTLAEGERVSSLAVRKVEGGYTLASITYASQFPLGRTPSAHGEVGASKARAPQPAASSQRAATVVVRALEEHGDLKRSPTVVSAKAESVGGIA